MKTLIIGNIYVDIIISIDNLPRAGHDIVCKNHTVNISESAYNVATILKNFGIDHTIIFPVGSEIYGKIMDEKVKKGRYEIKIRDSSKDNEYSLCLTKSNEGISFITIQGIEQSYQINWFEDINIDEYDNIYISGYELEGKRGQVISQWLSKVSDKNIFFRPGSRILEIDKDTLETVLSLRPIVHINEDEALKFTDKKSIVEAARAINKITQNTVFITLGKDGVMCASNCEYRFVDGFETQVVNTIGAGDSHIGAIIVAYSMGYNLGDCCYFANKVASKVVGIEESRLEEKYFKIEDYNIYDYLEAKG